MNQASFGFSHILAVKAQVYMHKGAFLMVFLLVSLGFLTNFKTLK